MIISFVILPSHPTFRPNPQTPNPLPGNHTDFHPIKHAQRNSNTFLVRPLITLFNGSKRLCKTNNSIARLGQCKLLANADTGSSAEGDIGPAWTEIWISPSFWAEFIGVGSEDLFSAMEDVRRKGQSGKFSLYVSYEKNDDYA